jgi:hypothetical protein
MKINSRDGVFLTFFNFYLLSFYIHLVVFTLLETSAKAPAANPRQH